LGAVPTAGERCVVVPSLAAKVGSSIAVETWS